ncbi:MAG TPA: cation-translocating P-type ATPase [Holophagaceae bacterium]|nr:cation-translocating P-type ATPase [Holophagaceae bacterium]
MTTRTFPVEGMTCASCVRRVEKALAAVPGVAAVQVNLASEEATVDFEGVAPEALAQALEARGYHLVLQAQGDEKARELRAALLRLVLAWVFTLPLLIEMAFGLHLDWRVQAVLSSVAVFGAGGGFFVRSAKQARHLEATMDTLVALGAGVAWLFGLAEGLRGEHHLTFETAAALVAFLLMGKYLETRAKGRAGDSLTALLKLAPATALRLGPDGAEETVPVALLQPGDRVRVRPGSAIPVDGVVVAGAAEVEEALLTGEPLPVPRGVGDAVIAGALVHGGSLDLEVRAAGRDTWLARLARQVGEARASKAPVQALADRVSAVFVPVVIVLALLTFAGWWFHTGALDLAWRPAVTVLVIACPCALGLATPVALTTALGTAARNGLLVRDAAAFERLGSITDLAFDKTGTLTAGRPMLQATRLLADGGADLLRLAAALERDSEHPLARGIREAAKGLDLPAVAGFRAHPGGGVSGVIGGRELRLGSAAFLGLAFPELPEDATAVGLAEGPRLLGLLILADALRPETPSAVAALQAEGLTLHLFSGDREAPVQRLAASLGIGSALGACTPATKRERLRALQAEGRVVAFVGDGINDGPALAQADAGLSLPGLEAAQEAAPLNLLREGLDPLLKARRLARRTRRIIRENLAWAFGYNLLLVPLAASGQLERFGGPMLAGAAMGLSSLTVVLNALRLRRV